LTQRIRSRRAQSARGGNAADRPRSRPTC
jgi:hypothetical protein